MDKQHINNHLIATHTAQHEGAHLTFHSAWHYPGEGERQQLKVRIERTTAEGESQVWQDEHPMVAVSFAELQELLAPYFEVQVFEHDYEKLVPWGGEAGNGVFVCRKW